MMLKFHDSDDNNDDDNDDEPTNAYECKTYKYIHYKIK
jgi:hypothetical protein